MLQIVSGSLAFCKKLLQYKLVRFSLVAGLNTLFGYLVYAFFLFVGLHYTIATFLATVVGVLFNFKTYGALVFQNRSNRLLLRFLVVYGVLYLCNAGFIFVMKKVGVSPYISGAVWLVPNGLLGFFLNGKFVYAHRVPKSA